MPDAANANAVPEETLPPESSGATGLTIHLGDAVRLRQPPRYLKTADPMPMLRPPDLVDPGEVGRVVEIRALDLLAVRFRRGTFLISAPDLEAAEPCG